MLLFRYDDTFADILRNHGYYLFIHVHVCLYSLCRVPDDADH